MLKVGERIRELRAERGWTQEFLAQRAGISKSFLSDLENGKRSVGAETLLDLGRAMDASLDFLMTGEASRDQPERNEIPPSLAHFATEEGLSVRRALVLLELHERIAAGRRARSRRKPTALEWRELYRAVKRFL